MKHYYSASVTVQAVRIVVQTHLYLLTYLLTYLKAVALRGKVGGTRKGGGTAEADICGLEEK